jgi:hypothetical protein
MMEAMESKLDNGMDRCIFIKKFTSRKREAPVSSLHVVKEILTKHFVRNLMVNVCRSRSRIAQSENVVETLSIAESHQYVLCHVNDLIERQLNIPRVHICAKQAPVTLEQSVKYRVLIISLMFIHFMLDRILSSYAGYVKHVLMSEQKKSDFRPSEGGNADLFSCTQVSQNFTPAVTSTVTTLSGIQQGTTLFQG